MYHYQYNTNNEHLRHRCSLIKCNPSSADAFDFIESCKIHAIGNVRIIIDAYMKTLNNTHAPNRVPKENGVDVNLMLFNQN